MVNSIKNIKLYDRIGLILSVLAILFSLLWIFRVDGLAIEPIVAFLGILGSLIGIFANTLIFKNKPSIFISYSHKDEKFVQKIVSELQKENISILWDKNLIQIGDSITEKIDNAIKSSDAVIVVLSENHSKYMEKELKQLFELKKHIIPLKISKDIEIPTALKDIKYAEIYSDESYFELFPALIKSIRSFT